ncbi:unnamed protein product [Haemonchus placei]|uniref:Secreted protein n=1 Tax=Haemonchus placei TaxID=6290 RepID=A0A0N4X0Y6_HAEPC|nr:unnamed protein product [Haemonchus placei]
MRPLHFTFMYHCVGLLESTHGRQFYKIEVTLQQVISLQCTHLCARRKCSRFYGNRLHRIG